MPPIYSYLPIGLVLIISIFCSSCVNEPKNLSKFKAVKYKKCFSTLYRPGERGNSWHESHTIYIKDLELNNRAKLTALQEFAICYSRNDTNLYSLILLDRYFDDVEDYDLRSKRVGIRLTRKNNQLAIRDILYFNNGSKVQLDIPILPRIDSCYN